MKTKQKTTLGLPLFPSTVCTSFVSQYFGHVSALHLAMPVTALLSLTALSRGSLWSLGISHLFLQLFSDFSISSPQSFLLSLLSPRSFIPPFLSLPCLFVLTLSAVYSWFPSSSLQLLVFFSPGLRVSLWSSHTLQLFAVCEAKSGRWETRSCELLLSSAVTFVCAFIFLFALAVGLAEEVSNWDSIATLSPSLPCQQRTLKPLSPAPINAQSMVSQEPMIQTPFPQLWFGDTVRKQTDEAKITQSSPTLRQNNHFQKETSLGSQRKDFVDWGSSVAIVLT